jgi:hypothetical protein
MANMSYCQFENTVRDMQQCLATLHEAADEGLSFGEFMADLSSEYEKRSVRSMKYLLVSMSEAFQRLDYNAPSEDK